MMQVIACDPAHAVQALVEQRGRLLEPEKLEPSTRSAVELGLRTSGARDLQHLADLRALSCRVAGCFERFDVLLTPVLAPRRRPGWADCRCATPSSSTTG